MKRLIVFSAVLASAAFGAGAASAQTIANSAHDLSSTNGTNTTQICVYCHTPHDALVANGPLWNRVPVGGQTFTMYSSNTLDGAIAAAPQLESAACLTCHDGATAFDSLNSQPSDGTAVSGLITGTQVIGVDLSNDHPISVTYGTDPGLVAIGSVTPTLPLFGASNDQVECATCHDVHNGTTFVSFLREDVAGSAICQTCHAK